MDVLVMMGATFVSLIPLVNPLNAIPLFAVMTTELSDSERSKLATKAGVYAGVILVVTAIAGVYILAFFGINIAMIQVAGGLIVAQSAWAMVTGNPQVSQTETTTWEKEKRPLSWKRMQRVVVRTVQNRDMTELTSHLHRSPAKQTRPEPPDRSASEPTPAADPEPNSQAPEPPAAAPSALAQGIAFSPVAMPLLSGPAAMGVVIGLTTQTDSAGETIGLFLGIALITVIAVYGLKASSAILHALGASGIIALQRIFGFILLAIAVNLIATGISALFGLTIYTS